MVPGLTSSFSAFSAPLRTVLIAAAVIILSVAGHAQDRAATASAFLRGINLADYLAYPESKDWPIFTGKRASITDAELKRLADAGLTYIRLPVEPGPFLERPAEQVAQLEERLGSFLRRAGAAGLAVMVTGFPRHEMPPWRPEDILRDPDGETFERYAGFLSQLAEILRKRPEVTTALELMNEPQPECYRDAGRDWTLAQQRLHARIRAAAPELTIVLTPGCWSGIDGLKTLAMAGYDRNTLVDVHFYEPFSFTHQGAGWTLPELRALGGLNFPANLTDSAVARAEIARLSVRNHPGDRRAQRQAYALGTRALAAYLRAGPDAASVSRRISEIAIWADREGLGHDRVIVGEFSALRPAPDGGAGDNGGRARWLEAARTAMEANGFGWSLWGYHSRFGLLAEGEDGAFDAATLRALGLTVPDTESRVNHPARHASDAAPPR